MRIGIDVARLMGVTDAASGPLCLVAPLHDRMPAILRPEDYERWVFGDWESALKAVGPYPAQVMQAQQLGQEINSSRNDYPELLPTCA